MNPLEKTQGQDQGLFFLPSCACGLIKTALPCGSRYLFINLQHSIELRVPGKITDGSSAG
jgi:hypothetical protein